MTRDDSHPNYPKQKVSSAILSVVKGAYLFLVNALLHEGSKNSKAAEATHLANGAPALDDLFKAVAFGTQNESTAAKRVLARLDKGAVQELVSDRAGATHAIVDKLIQKVESYNPNSEEDSFRDAVKSERRVADAVKILGILAAVKAVPTLIKLLEHENYLCVCSAGALAEIGEPQAIQPLVQVLQDETKFWVPRGAAAVALGEFGEKAAHVLPALEAARNYTADMDAETWDERAAEAVSDAINRIRNPDAESALKGQGYRYEMWGIY